MPEAWEQLEGQVVDQKFRLIRYLGSSENSAVFLTERDPDNPKKAVIKLIPADNERAELQLAHWKLAASLSHPHLAQLFETGRCQLGGVDALYVVMEYTDENLSQILPTRALTAQEARDLLKPVLEALTFLHSRGFVHGRLKPANLMVVGDQLKLSSDGLRRVGEPGDGPPSVYDPPESAQARMAPSRDVWSLGMTLVQALTQLLPVWDGKDQQTPILPEKLPAPFAEIVHNCLHRDPQKRWSLAQIATYAGLTLTLPATAAAKPVAAPKQVTRVAATATAQEPQRPQKAVAKRGYTGRALAAGVALAALIGGVRLLNRQPAAEPSPAAEIEIEQPISQPSAQKSAPPQTQASSRPRLTEAREVVPSPAPSPVRPAPQSPAAAGGVLPGKVVEQILPDVPRSARNTIRGTVRVSVRVRVDSTGDVASQQFVTAGPSRYFARLASDAAKQWKFTPPLRDGQAVPSAWILNFEFTQGGTRAVPAAVS